MGAYYEAAFEEDKIRFNTQDCDNGLKLMEHSYIGNTYVNSIEAKLINNPKKLVWLCDYHEKNKRTLLTWDTTNEESYKIIKDLTTKRIIVNHSKREFINIDKIKELYKKAGVTKYLVHPLPILCNSDEHSQGGGDYRVDDNRRSSWCEDKIEVILDVIKYEDYNDVTEKSLFFEKE